MRTVIISAIFICLSAISAKAQTVLTGKVKDSATGEDLIGATVKIMKGKAIVRGGCTNFDGEYRFQIDSAGTYDVEVSYSGYTASRTTGVSVLAGQINHFEVKMQSGVALQSCVITCYKMVPSGKKAKKEKLVRRKSLTSQNIKNLPTRSVNAIVAANAGTSSIDGQNVHIRGSRDNATNYYIDGVRVSQSTVPVQDIEQLPVQTSVKKDENPPATPPPADTAEGTREAYAQILENQFIEARKTPVSTFSIDVDAASYANTRRFIRNGQLPPRDAVRIEELVNYFDYQYPRPADEHPCEAITELGACPWQPENRLLLIALQGREMDLGQVPPSNFVFLVDVSGSMEDENKLPLVVQSLELLTDQLRPNDRVAIVVYAGAAGLVLPSTPSSDKAKIKTALQNLSAGGSTAGGAGIELAYKTARENFVAGGNNRVVLCTDGDFNIGVSSEGGLTQLIENERESGIYLTCLGYGMGNYQDATMQLLADKGNGNHAYIDDLAESQKVLVAEFGGTMYTIAKDVKLQLKFNPEAVASYRLIGYENRLLNEEDFDNDAKDAGELGLGHRVTALYEIVPRHTDRLFENLMTLKFRYKKPTGHGRSRLIEASVSEKPVAETSDNFRLAAAAAEFGLLLRDSKFKGNATWQHAAALAKSASTNDPHGYRAELQELILEAGRLASTTTATH